MPDASPDAHPGGTPAPALRTVAVRYQPGVVGESQRQSHLAQSSDPDSVEHWTT